MSSYNIEEHHKGDLDKIWKDFNDIEVINRRYLAPGKVKKNNLLFIGINPSVRKGEDTLPHSFYDLEIEAKKYSDYYSKFNGIAEHAGISWSHLDMLYFRKTNQKEIDKLISQRVDFIQRQLSVTKQILEIYSPRIMIVSNTKARLFLGKDASYNRQTKNWLGYQFKFDHKLGTDVITNDKSNLKSVPVFFTSMLSGQRALDNGSFERLKWHVKKVVKMIDW